MFGFFCLFVRLVGWSIFGFPKDPILNLTVRIILVIKLNSPFPKTLSWKRTDGSRPNARDWKREGCALDLTSLGRPKRPRH